MAKIRLKMMLCNAKLRADVYFRHILRKDLSQIHDRLGLSTCQPQLKTHTEICQKI